MTAIKHILFSLIFLVLFMCSYSQITQVELFIDTDPGQGNGFIMTAVDGSFDSKLEAALKTVTDTISLGLHTINIRIKDSTTWGPLFKTVFYSNPAFVPRAIKITQAELFLDTDPGAGSGTIMIAFDGNFDNALEQVFKDSVAAPAAGLHKIGVRVKDAVGTWGPVFTQVFKVDSVFTTRSIKLTTAEFFWGTDPGQGSGTAMLAFDGAFNQSLETVLSSSVSLPGYGNQKFSVRVKDDNNTWGPLFTQVVRVDSLFSPRNIKITQAEYFWDTDPGQGSATTLLAFDGAYDNALESALGSSAPLTYGPHQLNVRIKDITGTWGPVFKTAIKIDSVFSPRSINISLAEFFFDADPGAGNGVVMFALDGNFNQAIENAIKTVSLLPDTGYHLMSFRVKDVAGNWGPVFKTTLLVTPCANSPVVTITASGSTTICQGDSVLLTATAGYVSYSWLQGNTVVGTGQAYYAKTTGSYKVAVTDTGGCPGSSGFTAVTVTPISPSIAPSGPTTFCAGQNVTLFGGSGYVSYLWTTGATTSSITMDSAGTYNVTVSNGSCTRAATSVTVTVNPLPGTPTITAGGPTTFCVGQNVVLTSSPEIGYSWSNGFASQSITVNTTGSYTVAVTNSFGCSKTSAPTSVTVNTPNANITASGPLSFCQGGNVTLTSGASASYSWSTGVTTQAITVSASGNYTVTATDGAGCTASKTVTVTANPLPTTSIFANGPTTFCQGGSVTLSVNAANGYLWSNSSPAQSITVSQTGTYNITITDANGCTAAAAPVNVTVNANPAATIFTSGATSFCQGDSVVLTSSAGASYSWNNGSSAVSITVNQSGNYIITVTYSNGCITSAPGVNVTVNTSPVPSIFASGPTTFCAGDSVTLSTIAANSYQWSNGAITSSITLSQSGTFNVTVTSASGCKGIATPVVVSSIANTTPNVTSSGTTTFCQGGSVTLTSDSASTYQWSNGLSLKSITVSQAGSYKVTITDINGCTGVSNAVTITVNPVPGASITAGGPTTFCDGGSVTLTSNAANLYQWSNGSSTQSIIVTLSGSYNVTVTDANGCSSSASGTNVVVNTNPVASITSGGATTFCQGSSVTLTSSIASSYQWSNGLTAQAINVTQSGNYKVTVTDTKGCTGVSNTISVSVTPSPTATIFAGGPTAFCQGGSVLLTATAAAVSYIWSNGSTQQSITATQSGNQSVTITDGTGCSGSATTAVTVFLNPIPVISPAGPIALCQGDSSTLSSSLANVYLWSTGATSPSVGVNQAGSYKVTVTDANGCSGASQPVSVSVNSNPLVSITASGSTTFCQGGAVNLTAGSPTATGYLWSTGAFTQTISATQNTNYTVTVTDGNGCKASATSAIIVNPNPNASITPGGANTFCYGTSLLLTTTASVTYQWNTGAVTQSITVDSTGTFNVTITDANGCNSSASKSVNESPELFAVDSTVPATCNGVCDGKISVSASGGAPGYNYLWSGGLGSGASKTAVCAAVYTVTVTDAIGCTIVDSGKVSEPVKLLVATITTKLTCNVTVPDGSVSATVTGGTSPYTFAWSNGKVTPSITGIPSGYYSVTVTDMNGCTDDATDLVTTPTGLYASFVGTGITCNGLNNGTASIVAAGGPGPYSYIWSIGATTSGITGLSAGSFQGTITDVTGCGIYGKSYVNQSPVFIVSANVVNATVCGGSNGSVDITVSGGVSPYTYLWSDSMVTQDKSGVMAGNYIVTVTDSTACTKVKTVYVTAPSPATLSIVKANVNCKNGCDGTATVSVTGGTPPYTYLWNDPAATAAATAANLCAGTHSVTVVESNGCSATGTVLIAEPPLLNISASGISSTCGSKTGNASVNVGGGSPPYKFVWSDGDTLSTNDSLTAGIYSVTVTDNNGCSKFSIVPINDSDGPSVIVSGITNASCSGKSDGAINISVSGGAPPYNYKWSQGSMTEDVDSLAAGVYEIVVEDTAGCNITKSITVADATQITVNTVITNAMCGTSNGTVAAAVAGGSSPYSYLWNDSAATTTATATGLKAGAYTVTVSDTAGCSKKAVANLSANSAPLVIIDTIVKAACSGGGAISINLFGGTSPYDYLWSNGSTYEDLTNIQSGVYSLVVTDANGCAGVASATVGRIPPVADPICLITVDTLTILPTNRIVWQKTYNQGITEYRIYKEGSQSGVYYQIGTVPFDSLSAFTDPVSNPMQRSWRYKLGAVDSCGSVSMFSPEHKTIHLSMNIGLVPGTINLIWDHYQGFNFVTYNIWRYKPLKGWILIDAIPGTLFSYTDLNAPSIYGLRYFVEAIHPSGCTATKAAENHNTTRSNKTILAAPPAPPLTAGKSVTDATGQTTCDGVATVTPAGGVSPYAYLWSTTPVQSGDTATSLCPGVYSVTITDLDSASLVVQLTVGVQIGVSTISGESYVRVYPNPNSGLFTYNVKTTEPATVWAKITNVLGETVWKDIPQQISNEQVSQVNISHLPSGIYFLSVKVNDKVIVQKIVRE